jgi:signal peptidase II
MRSFLTPAALLAVFLLDRVSKSLVLEKLSAGPVRIFSFFSLTYVSNTGVSFGLFRGRNMFFVAFSAALVGVLLFLRRRIQAHGALAAAGFVLVLAGALGNLYDRIAYGFVVDFFNFSFFPAVFNVADSAITAGAVLLALGMKDADGAAGTGS